MKPQDVFDVQLVDVAGRPVQISEVSIRIDFFVRGRHRYGFRVGPTDKDGHARVTYEDIENRRLESLRAQPLDYKTRLEECDPTVRLSVPTRAELDSAVRIATSFNLGIVPPDAEQWMRANNHRVSCASIEVEIVGEVTVDISCDTATRRSSTVN
jgi:hypothetical protein